MFDLIGFWAAVTIIVFPPLFYIWWALEGFFNYELKALTKGQCQFNPVGKFLKKLFRKDLDLPVIFILFAMAIASALHIPLMFGGLVDCDTGEEISYIKAISQIAVDFVPVTSYIGMIGLALGAYYLGLRPMLVKAFALKEKIDKL